MRRRKIDRHVVESTEAAAAFAKLKPQFMRLDRSELLQVNLDIPWATTLVRGVAPAVQAFRAEILAELPEHPIAYVDHLVDYALACWQGYLQNLPVAIGEHLQVLLAEATPLRARVLDAADGLAHGKLLDADAVAEIHAGSGPLDTATDLSQLGVMLTAAWRKVHDKTYITLDEVHRCGVLGGQIHAALAERDHAKPTAENAELRARAFTLFVHVYNENRRAMSYLRWHQGDVDEIVPNLYARGGGPRRKSDSATSAEPTHASTTSSATSVAAVSAPGAASAPSAALSAHGGPFTQDPEPSR